jgi:hypothetical protein
MPDSLKQLAQKRIQASGYKSLQQIGRSLDRSSYDDQQWKLFCDFTRELDIMRDTNVLDVVPELKGYYQ